MSRVLHAFFALQIAGVAFMLPACAEMRSLVGKSNPTPRVVSPFENLGLSVETQMLANSMQLLPKLERLQELRAQSPASMTVDSKLELLTVRQDCAEAVQLASCEVRSVTARIDRECANAGEVLAYLAERRDRAVRLNTYADLVSGGLTGIISGSLKLGDVPGPAGDIIDTVEGAMQTGLSAWALQQQRGEQRREQGAPSILTHLFQQKSVAEKDYPPAVWSFLTMPLPAAANKACRVDNLVDRWLKLGLCFTHRGHRAGLEKRVQHVSGPNSPKVTVDILEDRVAMLNDLRATVVHMDVELLELMQVVQGSRSTASAGSTTN